MCSIALNKVRVIIILVRCKFSIGIIDIKIGVIMDDSNLTSVQLKNFEFFKGQLNEYLQDPLLKHKFVVIHNSKLQGAFDTFENALSDAVFKYPANEFIVQQVISDDETVGFLYSAVA
ncbi:hypothetical protein NO1_1280 [Candidatus Termititenax aidoneus]|uniref:DUF5678 domain-containing protein n=1 Tax=Termititenax aidoneus TaxID=2218524 RepID=A0A388TCF7_TERA1|nr:hypothetical protein NO1_1280 [Candidatus Termititenax aidoneus]